MFYAVTALSGEGADASGRAPVSCLAVMTATAPTTVPAARAMRNQANLPIAKNTKIPPCGAFSVTSKAMISAPVTAPPAIIDGITRNGSARGERDRAPGDERRSQGQAARPFSRSGSLNRRGRSVVASAIASGAPSRRPSPLP